MSPVHPTCTQSGDNADHKKIWNPKIDSELHEHKTSHWKYCGSFQKTSKHLDWTGVNQIKKISKKSIGKWINVTRTTETHTIRRHHEMIWNPESRLQRLMSTRQTSEKTWRLVALKVYIPWVIIIVVTNRIAQCHRLSPTMIFIKALFHVLKVWHWVKRVKSCGTTSLDKGCLPTM